MTKMRSSSVMCGGVMGDLSWGDGGAMRRDYSMSMATFHSTALLSSPGCGTRAEGSPGKEQPGKKVFSASGEEQQSCTTRSKLKYWWGLTFLQQGNCFFFPRLLLRMPSPRLMGLHCSDPSGQKWPLTHVTEVVPFNIRLRNSPC